MAENGEQFALRWGIVGCGLISSWFASDLCLDRPDVKVKHIIQAIGSSSTAKGSAFMSSHCPSQHPTIYDTYSGVYHDPDVDIVYIGTPHVLHCQNALDAIAAGKHVLCEKPIALNAKDAKRMFDAARDKGVFLMEAVWTRFFPIAQRFQDLLHRDKAIGEIASVFVDFGLRMPVSESDPKARTASRALGAGALLDIGIYSLTWASMALDTSSALGSTTEPDLVSSMIFCSETDLDKKFDEQTSMILRYKGLKTTAVCTCSMQYKTGEEFARVEGTKGSLSVGGVAASKPGYLMLRVDGEEKRLDFEVPGWGFHYEADAVAEDIRARRTENDTCSMSTTLMILDRMDKARAQCGLIYPQEE